MSKLHNKKGFMKTMKVIARRIENDSRNRFIMHEALRMYDDNCDGMYDAYFLEENMDEVINLIRLVGGTHAEFMIGAYKHYIEPHIKLRAIAEKYPEEYNQMMKEIEKDR